MIRDNVLVILSTVVPLVAGLFLTSACDSRGGDVSPTLGWNRLRCLPARTAEQRRILSDCSDKTLRRFAKSSDKEVFLDKLCKRLLGIEFDNSSYATRDNAISDYFHVVSSLTERLLATGESVDAIWRFKLAAIDRVNVEIRLCEGKPESDERGMPAMAGMFMTQRQYMMSLKARRFDAIRHEFEHGPFTLHYKALSPERRGEWIARLEKVAGRAVTIWDPDSQLMKMPAHDTHEERNDTERSEPVGDAMIIFHKVKER